MTIIIEISNPVQWRPLYRFGWLWFAIVVLRVPFRQFCETPQRWETS